MSWPSTAVSVDGCSGPQVQNKGRQKDAKEGLLIERARHKRPPHHHQPSTADAKLKRSWYRDVWQTVMETEQQQRERKGFVWKKEGNLSTWGVCRGLQLPVPEWVFTSPQSGRNKRQPNDWMAPHADTRTHEWFSGLSEITVWFYNVTVSQCLQLPQFCVIKQAGHFSPVVGKGNG